MKLNWSKNVNAVFNKAQSALFFLRKLKTIEVSKKCLNVFYQSFVALFYALVCWSNSITSNDRNRVKMFIKNVGSKIQLQQFTD